MLRDVSLLARLREFEDRLPRRAHGDVGAIYCHWCEQQNHPACTGVAIRPRFGPLAIDARRGYGQTKPCACFARGYSLTA